jgi:hypothetical protein
MLWVTNLLQYRKMYHTVAHSAAMNKMKRTRELISTLPFGTQLRR